MVAFKVIEKVKTILLEYATVKSDFGLSGVYNYQYSLIMFVPIESNLNRFALFISAPWLDNLSVHEVLEDLIPFVKQRMPDDEYVLIRRYALVKSSDPLIQNINYIFKTQDQILDVNNIHIGENFIEKAYILLSQSLEEQHA